MDGMEKEFFRALSESERAHLRATLRRLNEPAPAEDLAREAKS